MRKRIIIRTVFVALLILIGIFLYIIGREHKVLIDNKNISVGDVAYSTEAAYMIWIDNQEIGVIEQGKRKVAKVQGPSHKIVIEEIKDNVLTGEKHEKSFKLKTNENTTVNIRR